MYYPDLSIDDSRDSHKRHPLTYIGWLDPAYPYPTGALDPAILARIYQFCIHPAVVSLGFHPCPFCDQHIEITNLPVGSNTPYRLLLGSAETVVFGATAIYLMPCMIHHYIDDHDYVPALEFQQAILACPLPHTAAYRALLRKNQIDSIMT